MNIKIEQALSEIPHYKIHPEMKPFVGGMYDAFRIVLIGESHYTDLGSNANDSEEVQKEIEQWYSISVDKLPRHQKYINWYTTRQVLNNFLTHDRTHAYTMFSNPAKVLKEVVKETFKVTINDCDAFNGVIFFNYYQRPEIKRGSSFKERTEEDKQIAGETTYNIIHNTEIKPGLVVFTSKKAFDAYSKWTTKNKIPMDNCQYVAHPTCAHWYKENGEKKLKEKVTELLKGNEEVKTTLEKRKKNKTDAMKTVFQELSDYLIKKGFCIEERYDDACEVYYKEEKTGSFPYVQSKVCQNGVPLYFVIGIEWCLYCGIYKKEGANGNKNWQYIPSKENLVDFLGFAQKGFFKEIDAYEDEWIETLKESVGKYLETNRLEPL